MTEASLRAAEDRLAGTQPGRPTVVIKAHFWKRVNLRLHGIYRQVNPLLLVPRFYWLPTWSFCRGSWRGDIYWGYWNLEVKP